MILSAVNQVVDFRLVIALGNREIEKKKNTTDGGYRQLMSGFFFFNFTKIPLENPKKYSK